MKTQNKIEKITECFIKELAVKYNTPELNNVTIDVSPDGIASEVTCEVQPSGQFNLIVKTLKITIVVREHQHVKKLYTGQVRFSYSHFSHGSNGCDTNFYILTNCDWKNRIYYLGMVERSLFDDMRELMNSDMN